MITEIEETKKFTKSYDRLDLNLKERVKKLILKIIKNPKIGKPMQYCRKGTREVYLKPFRLSYAYAPQRNKICLLDFYHKKNQ